MTGCNKIVIKSSGIMGTVVRDILHTDPRAYAEFLKGWFDVYHILSWKAGGGAHGKACPRTYL